MSGILTQADIHWTELESVDSTNTWLLQAYSQRPLPGVQAVLARVQTGGRGRAGRSWLAQPDSALLLSLGFPVHTAQPMPHWPVCAGVGVAQALASVGITAQLKWPNDVLLLGGKLAGLLCETVSTVHGMQVIVGLGLNLTAAPAALPGGAWMPVALKSAWPADKAVPSARQLAERVVPAILSAIDAASSPAGWATLRALFRERDALLGQPLLVQDGGCTLLTGLGMGLADDGAYLLDTDAGLKSVVVGDLSIRRAA
ncbi:biotin--[acetyl-CoA-carboxylase] ligase [Limnobacter humi]|uniref:Biotin--[acetyl-CoA-carboxylase] ligase n=1 Tax=Limnobacter humi TaxID=1778671 RepID=A0ABT1WCZ2_9BURK|nr:biotin--[acetyl-CoA-carboxylase] ligase [Limnobacter humi]MCQ8895392.1 biotin--[acetyl-CoA-carboxylase] ligase [Limnobacter humi]